MAPKTDVIEQLRTRIAELEAEVERLSAAHVKACQANADSQAELAAEQLNNKLLREALEAVIKVHGYESGIPVEALSTQASTEALDKYVAEKVKEARRTAEYWKENHLAGNVQITTLTRQRDLAVEALKSCGVNDGLNGPTQYFDEDLVERAIKESDGK